MSDPNSETPVTPPATSGPPPAPAGAPSGAAAPGTLPPGATPSSGQPPPRSPIPPRRRSRRGRGWILLLLILLLAAAGLWGAWRWGFLPPPAHWLAGEADAPPVTPPWQVDLARQAQESAQAVQLAQSANEQLTRRVVELERRLGQLELAQARAPEPVSGYSAADQDRHVLSEAILMAQLAEQQLLLVGDARAARRLLATADELIASTDLDQRMALRAALAQDLTALGAAELRDPASLLLKLDALGQQVDRLVATRSVAAAVMLPESRVDPPAEGLPWWERFLSALPVEVSRVNPEVALPLEEEARELVSLTLQAGLQEARLALLQRDDARYHTALARVRTLAEDWFDTADPVVQNFINVALSLEEWTLARSLPDISEGLQAMRAVRAAQRREAER